MDAFYKTFPDGTRIPLSYYYLVNYMVTWFEGNFNARPASQMDVYDVKKRLFTSALCGAKPSFEEFYKTYVVEESTTEVSSSSVKLHRLLVRQESKRNDMKKQRMQEIYKYSRNLQEFAQKIERSDCSLYVPWVTTMIQKFFGSLLFKTWIINIEANMKKTLRIEPMVDGVCMFKHGSSPYDRKSCDV
jgi:hypothetical protein